MLPPELVETIYRNIWKLRIRQNVLPFIRNDDERRSMIRSIMRLTAANIGIPSATKRPEEDRDIHDDMFLDYIRAMTWWCPGYVHTKGDIFEELTDACIYETCSKRRFQRLLTCSISNELMKKFVVMLEEFHPDIHCYSYVDEDGDIFIDGYCGWTTRHRTNGYYRKSFESGAEHVEHIMPGRLNWDGIQSTDECWIRLRSLAF